MSTDPEIILQRRLTELKKSLKASLGPRSKVLWPRFERRLKLNFGRLHSSFYKLYGHRYDFEQQFRSLLHEMATAFAERSDALHELDAQRETADRWYLSQDAIGGVCYVDRFAQNLDGVRARIPYFKQLGITYLHLMPLFKCPQGRSDGGYAVSDYRSVNPKLGSMQDLEALAEELRGEGISLVLDFIYNHTSSEHEWAQRARRGEKKYLDFYYFFPDRQVPDAYEQTVREIFPEEKSGSFTYCEALEMWVWASFKNYQWDLNYGNPEVLRSMAGEMLFLANAGVEVLRLDAIAFAWKQMGTPCESLDPVYTLVEAFNAIARIAAPAMQFKSEAIVHPDEVARYIDPDRCQLSYNPMLMALLWESLATRRVDLLRHSLARRFAIHPDTQWVNYVRGHDDIGWTFSNEDAEEIGIDAYHHRRFLNQFYTGEFEGSFARGLPFQRNPKTGDCRVCGSTASLAGLEKALTEETETEVAIAVSRVLLLYGVIFSIGGIPLLYLGDELALLNDYSYRDDENHHDDSRWAQRPIFEKAHFQAVRKTGSAPHKLFNGICKLVRARQEAPALAGNQCDFLALPEPSVLGYLRASGESRLLVLNNFSERGATVPGELLQQYLDARVAVDVISGKKVVANSAVELAAYQSMWLRVGA